MITMNEYEKMMQIFTILLQTKSDANSTDLTSLTIIDNII